MGQLWSAAINPDTLSSSYFVLQSASRPSDSSLPRAYKMNALRGDRVCVFAYFTQHNRKNKRIMGKPCLCLRIFHLKHSNKMNAIRGNRVCVCAYFTQHNRKNKRIMGKPCLCVRGFQHIRTKYSKLVHTESFRLNDTLVRIITKVTTNLESHLLYMKHNTYKTDCIIFYDMWRWN